MFRETNAEEFPIPKDGGKTNKQEKIEESSDNIDDEHEPLQNEDNIASPTEALNAIAKAFTEDKNLFTKLRGFAKKILVQFDFNDRLLRLGEDNIVGMLIEKIGDGIRKWNKNLQPNIVRFMNMAIVSIIIDELKKKKQIKCVPLNDLKKSAYDLAEEQEELRNMHNIENINMIDFETNSTVEKKQITACAVPPSDDQFGDNEDIITNFEKEFENDTEAFCVLQERLDDVKSNQEIARKLGITVKEVENALKRIKRKFISSKNKIK
jgi:DNA-directed RNA polymerase specialized sigma subunit